MNDFVETYRNVIIQIATPNSTGTGFYLRDRGLIVTNHHVAEGNRVVVIEGAKFGKQLAKVHYADQKYDLAFLEGPHHMADLPKYGSEPAKHCANATRSLLSGIRSDSNFR